MELEHSIVEMIQYFAVCRASWLCRPLFAISEERRTYLLFLVLTLVDEP